MILFPLLEIGLLNSDVTVPVSEKMALYSSAENNPDRDLFDLSHWDRGRILSQIDSYAVLPDGVLVHNEDGYYRVELNGNVVELSDNLAQELRRPNRFQSPLFWTVQRWLAAAFVLWLLVCIGLRTISSRQRRSGEPEPER